MGARLLALQVVLPAHQAELQVRLGLRLIRAGPVGVARGCSPLWVAVSRLPRAPALMCPLEGWAGWSCAGRAQARPE